jgi:transcriptional regulator with XRE-family HTH domain
MGFAAQLPKGQWPPFRQSFKYYSAAIDTPLTCAYIFLWLQVPFRMPSTPFGDQLKREREMRGVSLEEVSAATRISTRFLEALEKEQWDRLPGGVFRRGFIRSVARFLGLDGDALISEYELQTKDIPKDPAAEQHLYDIPRDYRPAAAAIAVLAALLVGGWFAFAHYGSAIASRIHRQQLVPAPNSIVTPAAPLGPASTDPAVPLDLKIQAGKPSDLKVSADGKQVFDGHIAADEVKRFEARDTLEITATDPSALFLELNGQTVPPIGTPGQPGNITLTHKDLKPQSGGAH